MINLCTWNVRGLNDPQKIREVSKFIRDNNLHFVGLVETKIRVQNVAKLQNKLNKGWTWLNNSSCSPRGRIWIGWNPNEVNVTCLCMNKLFTVSWKFLFFLLFLC